MATSTISAVLKQATCTNTTSNVGTFELINKPSDFHCLVGVVSNSADDNSYVVQYDGDTLGLFVYATPHNPLANTSVTITYLYY